MFLSLRNSIKNFYALVVLVTLMYCLTLESANLWFFSYACEWLILIFSAALSTYIGFSGFFALTAAGGVFTALSLLKDSAFFISRDAQVLVSFGDVARLPSLSVNAILNLDQIGYSFGLLTSLIGAWVYFYAYSYMRFEKNILNFLIYLQIFKLSMMLLVWSANWVTLILGWELIGASSFLLINYWTSKITTLKSAFKALSFNKISDAALISAALISVWFGSSIIPTSPVFGAVLASKHLFVFNGCVSVNDLFLLCVCVASFCKSAQFGFHFWLPDSMEAPVPASALIHSATLVSAGIYLTMRFSFCFIYSPEILAIFKIVTSATALYGACVAAFQTDVKKILAYSTISHCGMLMFSITMFDAYVTIFYLFAHGFFKSLNFLCVGNFIQHANNYQDMSRMGNFSNLFGLEKFFIFVTAFNLSSAPLFLSFFSKHWLVNNLSQPSAVDYICATAIMATAFCGFFYSARLVYETLFSKKRAHYLTYSLKNCEPSTVLYVRRGNALGYFGMVALFFTCFFVIYVLFLNRFALSLSSNDLCGFRVITLNYQTALLLCFSLTLFVIAVSFLTFKRAKTKTTFFAAAVIVYCVLLSAF